MLLLQIWQDVIVKFFYRRNEPVVTNIRYDDANFTFAEGATVVFILSFRNKWIKTKLTIL